MDFLTERITNAFNWFLPDVAAPGSSSFGDFYTELQTTAAPNYGSDWVQLQLSLIAAFTIFVFVTVAIVVLAKFGWELVRPGARYRRLRELGTDFVQSLFLAFSTPLVVLFFAINTAAAAILTKILLGWIDRSSFTEDQLVQYLGFDLGVLSVVANTGLALIGDFLSFLLIVELGLLVLAAVVAMLMTAATIPAIHIGGWAKSLAANSMRLGVIGVYGVVIMTLGLLFVSWAMQFMTFAPDFPGDETVIGVIILALLTAMLSIPYWFWKAYNKWVHQLIVKRIDSNDFFNQRLNTENFKGDKRRELKRQVEQTGGHGRPIRGDTPGVAAAKRQQGVLKRATMVADAGAAKLITSGDGTAATAGVVLKTGSEIGKKRIKSLEGKIEEARRNDPLRRHTTNDKWANV